MKREGGDRDRKGPRLPLLSIGLMLLFTGGGSLALLTHWPAGPAHLDWGVWIVVYLGYPYVIVASFLHLVTGR